MNKKGQAGQIGVLIVIAIAVILGAILLQASASNIGQVTNTITLANRTLGTADNITTVYMTDIKLLSNAVVYNSTTSVVNAANYTLTNNVVYNGALAVSIKPINTTGLNYEWFISGTGQPITYDSDIGGRAVAGLILIFFALAIAVITLVPILREKIFE